MSRSIVRGREVATTLTPAISDQHTPFPSHDSRPKPGADPLDIPRDPDMLTVLPEPRCRPCHTFTSLYPHMTSLLLHTLASTPALLFHIKEAKEPRVLVRGVASVIHSMLMPPAVPCIPSCMPSL